MVLHITDFIVFGGLVVGTGLIGIYFGIVKRSRSISEYMTGDKNAILPVLFSTIITLTTPKQMIADPTAVIMYGTQCEVGLGLGVLMGASIYIISFMPVQKTLKSRSLLKYFDLRHNKAVHTMVAVVLIIRDVLLLPVLIYMPAMVLNEMLGVPIIYSTTTVTIICILYTCSGGLKAVLWTDSLQYVYFLVAVVVSACVGLYKIGGVTKVWQNGLDGERIEFINFEGHPLYDRANFLGALVTGSLYTLCVGVSNQAFYQRIHGLRDESKSASVAMASFFGFFVSRFNGSIAGLVIYSYFKDCHPLLTKEISKPDGIVPLFISKMSETVPGVLGLFLAGVVAASLSTISTSLNTIACLVHDDIVLTVSSRDLTEKTSFSIMKSTIVITGLGSLAITPLFANVKSLQQIGLSSSGVTTGTALSLFAGMVNPWVNNIGIVSGAVVGVLVPAWLFYSQVQLTTQGKLSYPSKLITTTGCNRTIDGWFSNVTSSGFSGPGTQVVIDFSDSMTKFTAVSYLWYSSIGLGAALVVSTVVSLFTGVKDVSKVDESLICPQMRWVLPRKTSRKKDEDEPETVPLK